MSDQTSAVSSSNDSSSNAFSCEFKMMEMEKELTRFIEEYVKDLHSRMSVLQHKLGIEVQPIVFSQPDQTDRLLRSEAAAFDERTKSDGLIQQVSHLRDELSNMNARIKNLEDLCRTNAFHLERFRNTEDSVRNLIKTELDATLEKRVKSILKNFEMSADNTENKCLDQGNRESLIFNKFSRWSREKSNDEPEEVKLEFGKSTAGQVRRASDQEDLKSRQENLRETLGRGDHQLKSSDGMPEESLHEATIYEVQSSISTRNIEQPVSLESKLEGDTEHMGSEMEHNVSTRNLDQPLSLEGMLEGGTGKNSDREMQPAASTRTLDQPLSLEGMLEGGTGKNSDREMHPAASTRTLDQPLSLEGMLEEGTGKNSDREMHPAASTRTLDQPKSLEGMLEEGTGKNTVREMHPAVSTRTLDQPKSLEGMLEEGTGKNTVREMQPAVSTRTLDQPMSLEGMLEGLTLESSKVKPPIPSEHSDQKPKTLPKPFRIFQKKPKKSSKVPFAGDPDESGESSKAKEGSKGKKS